MLASKLAAPYKCTCIWSAATCSACGFASLPRPHFPPKGGKRGVWGEGCGAAGSPQSYSAKLIYGKACLKQAFPHEFQLSVSSC